MGWIITSIYPTQSRFCPPSFRNDHFQSYIYWKKCFLWFWNRCYHLNCLHISSHSSESSAEWNESLQFKGNCKYVLVVWRPAKCSMNEQWMKKCWILAWIPCHIVISVNPVDRCLLMTHWLSFLFFCQINSSAFLCYWDNLACFAS